MNGEPSGLLALARELLPAFAVFGVLALVVKRNAILAAVERCRAEATTNLLLLTCNALLVGPLLVLPAATLEGIYGRPALLAGLWPKLPEPLVLLVAIVLVDFVAYWRHRFEHREGLWRFHATHHADTAIHWLTVHRKHPVGKLISMMVDNALILMLGVPLWAVAGAAVLRTWWGYFIHADVPWTLGIFGEVMMSPAAHRLHHIRDEALMGTNFGNTVTLWDKLFGTWCDPSPHLDCETGIAEGTRGWAGEIARPWERRYRGKPEREQPAA